MTGSGGRGKTTTNANATSPIPRNKISLFFGGNKKNPQHSGRKQMQQRSVNTSINSEKPG